MKSVSRPAPRPLVPKLENWGKKLFVADPSSSAVLDYGAAALARCASPLTNNRTACFPTGWGGEGVQKRNWSSVLEP